MNRILQDIDGQAVGALIFRVALFAAAASLAAYIPFKYATQFHVMKGFYGFVFPFSAILAVTGMALALKPAAACSCNFGVSARAALGSVSVLWLVTGLLCATTLVAKFPISIGSGAFAVFHMTVQHIFLSATVFTFVVAPAWMARKLAVADRSAAPSVAPDRALQA